MADRGDGGNGGGQGQSPSRTDIADRKWHALPVDETLDALAVDADEGLSDEAIEKRRAEFGENKLSQGAQRTMVQRLLSQFNNLFIHLLLVAGVITALLGEWLDSGVIFAVVFIIAIIGFIQEGRAEKALESVRDILTSEAFARRRGKKRKIAAEELVPGDIVYLEAGDRVPADLRLIRIRNLQTQEAALTGESTAVEKKTDPVDQGADLGDRLCMAYSGTLVTAGIGTGIVTAIGDRTEIGRISGLLKDVEKLKTPLMQRLDAFTKVLSVVIIAIAALTFAVGVLVWGREWAEMFFAAVSIAVAAIPEGLPAVMTVTLAIGVERMARRNAIIRRLPAVETLGSVTTICADKTGTLTRNEMTAKTVRSGVQDITVEGVGYEPKGGFTSDEKDLEIEKGMLAHTMIRAGLLCNDAELVQKGENSDKSSWQPEGDPTEAALIVLARKAGFDPDQENRDHPRLDSIPFSSERRYMATLNHDHEGNHVIYVKGAPERILEMCASEQGDEGTRDLDRDAWMERVDAIAGRGQRLLAVARKDVSEQSELNEEHVEKGELVFLGLFGLMDPPRDEAIESVRVCHDAGIAVKMITGDHAATARAVAKELGLRHTDKVVTGRELEEISDEDLPRIAMDVDVFARASPEHKLRLVKALQSQKQICAMTGDGVNDAPALKRADVGISMGQKGTEAAREASAMVLADDNFASIQRAVEEGRTVYDNLRKAILFILPTNAAQALIVVTAIMVGLVLPVTPVQILWVNMITAVTLGIAFAWEKAEGNVMKRQPQPVEEPLLTPFVIWRIGFVGAILLIGAGGLFLAHHDGDGNLAYARTMAVNGLVMGQIFYLLNTRFFTAPAYTAEGITGNRVVLIAIGICIALQLLFTYAPFMNLLFETAPLDAMAWAQCIAVGIVVFVLVEAEKALARAGKHPFARDFTKPAHRG
ncbi:MAG: cation-transporting P-type ATPase [Salinarimonas sp.]|nr:cation-transporting P-type ATPase [Salinarimonas sp.]